MALQISYDDKYGVTHPEAYCRVEYVAVRKSPAGYLTKYRIDIYDSATNKDKAAVGSVEQDYIDPKNSLAYDLGGDNLLAQIYENAKTLDDFDGSEDV